MKVSAINSAKHIIAEMILKEQYAHASLLGDIAERAPNTKLLDELRLVHNTRLELLDSILLKLKEIK